MPIYGYICKSCEHRFDVLQKMSDDPLVHCPDCGEPSLQKELSAPKFRLKGSGWYETDFKKGDKKKKDDGDAGETGDVGPIDEPGDTGDEGGEEGGEQPTMQPFDY